MNYLFQKLTYKKNSPNDRNEKKKLEEVLAPNATNDLQELFNMKYIMTFRLNQDVVENIFSRVQTKGGLYDHPSALTTMYRIWDIILSTEYNSVSKKANVSSLEPEAENPDEEEPFLLGIAFKKAKLPIEKIAPAYHEFIEI